MNNLDLNKITRLTNRKEILSIAIMHNTVFLFILALFGIIGSDGSILEFLMRAGAIIYPTSLLASVFVKVIMNAWKINTVSSELHELHNEKDESFYDKFFCYAWMIIVHLPFFLAEFLEALLVTNFMAIVMKYLSRPLFGAWIYMAVKAVVLIYMYQNAVYKCRRVEEEINKMLEEKKEGKFTWNT